MTDRKALIHMRINTFRLLGAFVFLGMAGLAQASSVERLVLINADTNLPVPGYEILVDGMTLNLATLPRYLNIEARTNPGRVGSVLFGLDGNPKFRIESAWPYALAGDSGGRYNRWTPTLGNHTVSATPFSSAGAKGTQGATLVIRFAVVKSTTTANEPPHAKMDLSPLSGTAPLRITGDASESMDPDGSIVSHSWTLGNSSSAEGLRIQHDFVSPGQYPVTLTVKDAMGATATVTQQVQVQAPASEAGLAIQSFTLIDADLDRPLPGYELIDGDVTLDLATLPTTNLNLRANTSPVKVGSVRFGLNANLKFRTENAAPYALAGDTNGNYAPWKPSLGIYTLQATPYSSPNASGEAGVPLIVRLNFIQNTTSPGEPEENPICGAAGAAVSGDLMKWHRVTLTFDGPDVSESGSPNPFLDYRLDVIFISPSNRRMVVPGFYAADGEAAETGATNGNKWQVRFAPDEVGTWTYAASFRFGANVAVLDASAGEAACFDGATGKFLVQATNKTGRDHRRKGLLRYTGERYLRFAETGEYFLKGGADSPENFLAYADFDQTPDTHFYWPHASDWKAGNPVWQSGKGKSIIGALNYLSGEGMNSVYFLTMNVGGDGKDVWPWTSSSERLRFDVSKLAQWEIVFTHMDSLGIQLHVVTQETENDQLLDGGDLKTQRRLYYRELIARFSHHLALVWNLGEENTNSDSQRKEFANYIRSTDPYQHPVVVHTFPGSTTSVYNPLLGFPHLEGPSLQMGNMDHTHAETIRWIDQSASSGLPWFVCLDEIGPAGAGVLPDANDPTHDQVRKEALWGNLMAGGAGVEWYFGYGYAHNDLNAEDFRSRDTMWNQTRFALEFFQTYLPFSRMVHQDSRTPATNDYVLAEESKAYAVYLKDAGQSPLLDLGQSATGQFVVRWYDPRSGGLLQNGSLRTVIGPGIVSLGDPPQDRQKDWVVLVTAQ
jgi:PKD repeat protein